MAWPNSFECDVLDDDVFDHQQCADLLLRDLEGPGLDLFAVLDDLLGALQGGHFLERLLDARRDERLEGMSIILLEQPDHGSFRDAVKHPQLHVNLLQVR